MKHLKLIALSLAAVGVAISSSCATTRGFGQDLQKVGNRLENQADATGGAEPDRTTPAAAATSPGAPSAY